VSRDPKDVLTNEAASALLDFGPRALTALDRVIEAADPGESRCCDGCGLTKVEHWRNRETRTQLRAMRDKLARWISEAHGARPVEEDRDG